MSIGQASQQSYEPGANGMLDRATHKKLIQFQDRKTHLRLARGLATVVAIFVAVLLVAISLDASINSPAIRWTGSLAVYCVTGFMLAWLCVRPFLRPVALSNIARDFERSEPLVEDRLLSAVELAQDDEVHDSLAFRQQLQRQVASAIAPINVVQLLPWQSIARYLLVGSAAAILLTLLYFVPGLHFSQRVSRMLLPAANVGRVSHIAIRIERPAPPSQTVPLGDIVAITARIDGRLQDQVWLETRVGEDVEQLEMHLLQNMGDLAGSPSASESPNGLRFESTLVANEPSLDYRVTADGAATPWHRLLTKTRPRIVSFDKRIFLPDYAGTSEIHVQEPHGDIEALVGSRVRLTLESDQPITTGELRWESINDESAEVTPLTIGDEPTRLTCEIEVDRSKTYRVFLQSAVTRFTNEYSRQYQVAAIPDRPPVVQWLRPQAASLAVAPNALIDLSVQVSDELNVGRVEQWMRLNSDEWTSVELTTPQPGQTTWSWPFDLLGHTVEAGDYFETKIVATDRNGSVGETSLLRLLISSTAMDYALNEAAGSRLEVAEHLDAFALQLQTLTDAASATPIPSAIEEVAVFLERDIPGLLDQIEQAASLNTDIVSAMELRLTGEVLAQWLTTERLAMAQSAQDISEDTKKTAMKRITQLNNRASTLAKSFRAMVTHDMVQRHSGRLRTLATEYRELVDLESASNEQKARRLSILSRQVRDVHQAFVDEVDTAHQDSKRNLLRHTDSLLKLAEQIDQRLDKASPAISDTATFAADNLEGNALESRIDGSLSESIKRGHRWLHDNLSKPEQVVQRLAAELSKAPLVAVPEVVLEQLALRRSLVRASPQANLEWASDLGLARRATQHALDLSNNDQASDAQETAKTVSRIAELLRVLSAADSLHDAHEQLSVLLRGERWSISGSLATTHHPRLWDAFVLRVERGARHMREARFPNELVSRFDRLRWDSNAGLAGGRVTSRRWDGKDNVSAAPQLDILHQASHEVLSELKPIVQEARRELQSLAPSIPELAQKAASSVRELERQTSSVAESLEQTNADEVQSKLDQLRQEAERVSPPFVDLREALVDQADSQELLSTQGVELARRADAAIDIVDRAESQTQNSLDNLPATTAAEPDQAELADQQEALAEAAGQQADAAKALSQLANMFDPAAIQEATEAVLASQTASLNEISNQLATDEGAFGSDSALDEAQTLAELAEARPEDVLKQLEEELQINPEMQSEMSDIARAAANAALNDLEHATNEQASIVPRLEDSDPALKAQKKLLVHDLQAARDAASRMLRPLMAESKWTAGAAKEQENAEQIGESEERLKVAIDDTADASANQSFEQLQDKATKLHEAMRSIQETMLDAGQKIAQAKDREIHQNGADLNNRRREMKDRQRRIQQQDTRSAQQIESSLQRRVRTADNDLRQAQQRLKNSSKQLTDLEKRLNKQPDSQSLKDQIERKQREVALAESAATAEKNAADAFRDRATQARELVQQISRRKLPQLAGQNPSAELSADMAQLAAERSQQVADALAQWSEPSPKIEPTLQQLQQSVNQEERIAEETEGAADQLARAARHEQRLDNETTSDQLAQVAEQVESIAGHELLEARQQFEAAGSEDANSPTGQAQSSQAEQAADASIQATEALANSASRLREMLAAASAPADASQASSAAESTSDNPQQGTSQPGDSQQASSSSSQSSSPQSSSLSDQGLDPQQMAQLLDELDQQLNRQAQLGEQEDNAQGRTADSGDSPSQNAQPMPGTLTEAAKQLASRMSQQREPPSSPANSDIGMATESQMANVDPQGPVSVRVIQVDRLNGNWGQLREQRQEGTVDSQRDVLAPQFRQQVEAYFRSLSLEGHSGVSDGPGTSNGSSAESGSRGSQP